MTKKIQTPKKIHTTLHKIEGKGFWNTYMGKYQGRQKIFAYIMFVLVFVSSSFIYIQAYKTYSTKSGKDLSLVAYIILLISNIGWVLYGFFVLKDLPIIIGGGLYVIGSILLICLIVKYPH